jgi:aldose 1-epimerase
MSVVTLRAGQSELRLLPAAGGRITACTLSSRDGTLQDVLQPYPEHRTDLEDWAKGGIYPLVPYNGRIRDAQLHHADRVWSLAAHAGSPHTLHGIAQRRPWHLLQSGTGQARLGYTHTPDAHWPWSFDTDMDVALEPGGVRIVLTLHNTSTTDMPGGLGLHPYFVHRPDNRLRFDAGSSWPFDADYLPQEPPEEAGQRHAWTLDAPCFAAGEVTHFIPNWSGTLDISSAQAQRVRLTASGAMNQLVIHRPAQAPHVCIEPVSHVPDGFNLHAQGVPGTGTRILAPGEQLQGQLDIMLE